MNVAYSFAEYIENILSLTLGTDLFVGAVPLDAPDKSCWLVAGGGAPQPKNNTGERRKDYVISVYYRNIDAQDVYDSMQVLEDEINSKHCTQLSGYDTVDMEAIVFPTDQDLDNQERTISLMQVNLEVYSS